MPVGSVMSRDAKLAVAGTICAMVWSVIAARSVEPIALATGLVVVSVGLPVIAWVYAARLRAQKSPQAERLMLGAFAAEFVVMLAVDFLGWLTAR
jgi:hypothetical protein